MVGVLTRADLVKGLTQPGADTPVVAAMTSHFECAAPLEMLEGAAVEFAGRRYDTGDKLGFLKATVEFALARPDLADDFRTYLKSLNL